MEILEAYIPADRRHALATRRPLPERTQGAALFADISGFTPLTEALTRTYGTRRGPEELTIYLNRVYEALVAEVSRFDGSVVAFAGDAITCWFDQDTGWRATVCALAMQATMEQFAAIVLPDGARMPLAVKIAIAAGPVRRFVVGHPEVQLLDVLAGQTLATMGVGAHLAGRGEILLDPTAAQNLGEALQVTGWREVPETGARFAVAGRCSGSIELVPRPGARQLSPEILKPWLLRPVFERLRSGQGEFLTELRPANAVFVRFDGIDYDRDDQAGAKLDAYVRWVQQVVGLYEGFLIDVSMGDKGSYLYACFGAPIAHENDPWRAFAAAHELCRPPASLSFITSTQIGINGGTMRVGAYGSLQRRAYGVLGDDVNLAARLMEHSAPGQVLASERLQRAADAHFHWRALPALQAKGKAEPIPIFALLGPAAQGTLSVQNQPALPLVGRTRELQVIADKLGLAASGAGQCIQICAEAGLGKSRLVAEALPLASKLGFRAHVGQCASHGMSSGYLAWQPIWRELLELPSAEPERQITSIELRLGELDPALLPRLPLLAPVLGLPIPENALTRPLEARLRKASLESLLTDILRRIATNGPLLFVLEDTHWIDSLSLDLLSTITRAIARLPVLLIVTRRPPESGRIEQGDLLAPGRINLDAFTEAEAASFVSLKLARLFDFNGPPPRHLLSRLLARSAGNPFYLEELLNYLRDRRVDFRSAEGLDALELPNSLHTLVLSRIDRLSESQRATLKIASVIGRLFPAEVLLGMQPQFERRQVTADLDHLCRVEITLLDRPEPDLTYLFKHVVTQEVTYESLPHATRARLHQDIGLLLEKLYPTELEQKVDLLAFHFDRSPNLEKKRHYLLRAGEIAQAHYANHEALNYFERALPLLSEAERVPVFLRLGKIRELIGEWKKAGACYQQAFEAAEASADLSGQAQAQVATGDLLRKQGLFAEATDWLGVARTRFEEINDLAGVGQALHAAGTVAAMQGDYPTAKKLYGQSLALREKLDNRGQVAALLSNLGIIARFEGDLPLARHLNEKSLSLRREADDRWAVANSLNNLGMVLRDLRELSTARQVLEESLALNRLVGDRWAVANVLSSLAEVALDQQDWPAARRFLEDSLNINLELDDRTAVAFVFECFAVMAANLEQPEHALLLTGAADALRTATGAPLSPAEKQRLDATLLSSRHQLTPEQQSAAFQRGAKLSFAEAVEQARQA